MSLLEGLVPVMVSPMDAAGNPDPSGIENLVNLLVESGSGGLWVLGSGGEDINITAEQRWVLTRETTAACAGRVPVIAGTGMTAIGEIVAYSERLADCDIAGIHILPFDIKMSEARLIHFFTATADELPHPLWLYHNPKRGRPITAAVIEAVRDHDNIAGMKVGGYSLTEMVSATMLATESFQVVGAGTGNLFGMLSLGAEAHTTSEGSCFPEPFVEIIEAFRAGDHERALELQHRVIRLSRAFPRTGNGEYSAEEKFVLKLRGVCEEYVNPLYRRLNEDEKSRIIDALKEYGFPWA